LICYSVAFACNSGIASDATARRQYYTYPQPAQRGGAKKSVSFAILFAAFAITPAYFPATRLRRELIIDVARH